VEFIAERTCLACGQRRALTTGQHQYQRDPNDASESASAEEKIEMMLTHATIERLYEEFKRRIKIQTVLPSAETAAISFWALLASGRVTMRKADGWRSLVKKSSDKIIELAARGGNIVTPGIAPNSIPTQIPTAPAPVHFVSIKRFRICDGRR